jgi:hypothetical protein
MAFTIGSGTFTNGSATVTGVTLTSGTLAYFASGTRMVVGVNPVIQEVEAIAAPTVTTITLRSAWTGAGGTYSFLANQTSEGLRDAVQAIRTNNASLQSFIDSIDTAATADSVAQRTSDGSINAVDVNATRLLTTGKVGIGTSSPASDANMTLLGNITDGTITQLDQPGVANWRVGLVPNTDAYAIYGFGSGSYPERMRIDSSGNVGIGTSSPNANSKLTLKDGTAASLYFASDGAGGDQAYIALQKSADGLTFGVENRGFVWKTGSGTVLGGTERMRIDSSGNLLVGTTSGSSHTFSKNSYQPVVYVKDVNPDNTGSRTGMAIDVGTFDSADSSSVFISLRRRDSTQVGSIMRSGTSAVSYNTSSDYRLKEDWQPMVGNIDRLMQLKPCNFAWKVDGSRVDGFLAHEAQEVVPEAVHGTKDAMRTEQYEVSPAVYEDVVIPAEFDEDGNEISPERTEQRLVSEAVMGEREVPEYQGIDQSKLVPLLTATLQDAIKKIEALEARIEVLEG